MLTRRGRSGQAAVFVALCLMALLLVIAFATNTGIAVNDRLRMQETADLATYAAAYSEAAALNDITKKNKAIAQSVEDCRRTLEGTIWSTPCNCGPTDPMAEIQLQVMCRADISAAILDFVGTADYSSSVEPAIKAGKRTAEANFKGTANHTTFFENTFGSPTSRWTYSTFWSTPSGLAGLSATIADFEQVSDTKFNYQYMQFCGSHCSPSGISTRAAVDMPTWFYKGSKDPDVWVAGRVSGTPEKRFLDTDYRTSGRDRGYFGGSSTGGDDLLVSYAVAKPYDGSVGPSDVSGIQQNGNMVGAGGVYIARGVTYPELSMYDEYRARMAGIQDGLGGTLSPTTLIALDGAELGKSWDTSKFEH